MQPALFNRKGYRNYVDAYFLMCGFSLFGMIPRALEIFNTAHSVLLADLVFFLWVISTAVRSSYFRVRVGRSDLLFLCILALSLICGFANGYDGVDITVDFLRPVLFFGTYVLFRNADLKLVLAQTPSLHRMNQFLMLAGIAFLGFFATYLTQPGIYLSATEVYHLFPLVFFFLTGRFLQSSLFLLMVLGGGRRGVLFALIIGLLPRFFKRSALLPITVALLAIVVIFSFSNPIADTLLSFGTIGKFVSFYRGAVQGGASDVGDIFFRMFDDRMAEITSVTRDLADSPFALVFGRGLGFKYQLENPLRAMTPIQIRGVHFSPLGIYAQFGILGFLFIYIFLFRLAWRACHFVRMGYGTMVTLSAFFTLAYIGETFTVFSIFLSPVFAICAGVVMNPALALKLEVESESIEENDWIEATRRKMLFSTPVPR